jgi:hypothetical protein
MARTDDRRGDPRLLQDVASGNGGDADPVSAGYLPKYSQQILERAPPTKLVDDEHVFRDRAVLEGRLRSRHAQVSVRQETTGYSTIAQQRYAMPATKVHHTRFGAAVEDRILDLVRHYRHAGLKDLFNTRYVEIGQADLLDLARAPQIVETGRDLYVPGNLIIPPVELDQIQLLNTQAPKRAFNGPLHTGSGERRKRSEIRDILGVNLYLGQCTAAEVVSVLAQELADELLDPGIDVGAIKGSDTSLEIEVHVTEGLPAIDGSMAASKLPAPLDDSGDSLLGR